MDNLFKIEIPRSVLSLQFATIKAEISTKIDFAQDKLVESSSKPSIPSISTINAGPLSASMNHRVRGDAIHFEAFQGSIRDLSGQNNQVLGQISSNISALKLQENVDLFNQMKENITAILNDMRCMPGPPLPVSLNEELANTILSIKNQTDDVRLIRRDEYQTRTEVLVRDGSFGL